MKTKQFTVILCLLLGTNLFAQSSIVESKINQINIKLKKLESQYLKAKLNLINAKIKHFDTLLKVSMKKGDLDNARKLLEKAVKAQNKEMQKEFLAKFTNPSGDIKTSQEVLAVRRKNSKSKDGGRGSR